MFIYFWTRHHLILSYFKDKEVEYTFIPAKLTRFLQPLDIGINFPFKVHLKINTWSMKLIK